MTEGSIRWDDERRAIIKTATVVIYRTMPNLHVYIGPSNDKNTKLYYCCHTAGKWYKPIESTD